MKNLFLILLVSIISSASLLCQQANILHIVNADTQTPIPFAIVSNLEKSNGGYANEEGVFVFGERDLVSVDSLVVSAIGYQDTVVEVHVLSSGDTIRLVPTDLTLSEVVVTASSQTGEDEARYLGVGVNQKRHNSSLSLCPSEYAIKMEKENIKDEIDQVYIYFHKSGANEALFKVKIYNEKDGIPSELLFSTIVKPEKKLKKWNAISLSREDITKDEKIFFVAFELLETNDGLYTITKGSITSCYGQVLGLAKSKQTDLCFTKFSRNDDWRARPGIFNNHLPMIKVKIK